MKILGDGIVIMMHFEYRKDILNQILNNGIFTNSKYVGRLGRFVIYELK